MTHIKTKDSLSQQFKTRCGGKEMTLLFVHSTKRGATDFQSNMHMPVRQNPNLSTEASIRVQLK